MTQEEWDRLLIESFYLRPDVPMWRIKWEADTDSDLLRTPERLHMKVTVCRFVVGHLPKLGKLLWKMKLKDIDQLVRVLGKSGMKTLKKDNSFVECQDKKMINKSKKLSCETGKLRHGIMDGKLKSGGHDWATVK
jgi:hypothetical protein